jgi:hypothetical protein
MVTSLFADRLAEYGIPVFEIRPGIIRSDMTAGVIKKYEGEIVSDNGKKTEAKFVTENASLSAAEEHNRWKKKVQETAGEEEAIAFLCAKGRQWNTPGSGTITKPLNAVTAFSTLQPGTRNGRIGVCLCALMELFPRPLPKHQPRQQSQRCGVGQWANMSPLRKHS